MSYRADRRAVGRLASDIPPETMRWIDPGRIALGGLAIIDGNPGLGKTSVSLDYAARVTRGLEMPNGVKGDLYGKPSGVIIISCEDNPASVLVPKLMLMGADLTKIFFVDYTTDEDGEEHSIDYLDIPALHQVIRQLSARMVIWDPFMAYMPEGKNAYRDQDVRKTLMPLVKWAQVEDIALLVIRHFNKMGGDTKIDIDPIDRGGGSRGISAAARTMLGVVRDDDDEEKRVLVGIKTNATKERAVPNLLFHLHGADDFSPAVVVWDGATAKKAADLMRPKSLDEAPALKEACDFLVAYLGDGEQHPVKEIEREARRAGIAIRTLRRARPRIGADSNKGRETSHDGFLWSLSPKAKASWEARLNGSAPAKAAVNLAKVATPKACQVLTEPPYPCYFHVVGELA